jgi:hypothetical protein
MKKADMHVRARATDAMVCDFCGAPTPAPRLTCFPCGDFIRRVIHRGDTTLVEPCVCHSPRTLEPEDRVAEQRVVGDWCACPRCAKPVRARDSKRLIALAVASPHAPEVPGVTRADLIEGLHFGFWLHRLPES